MWRCSGIARTRLPRLVHCNLHLYWILKNQCWIGKEWKLCSFGVLYLLWHFNNAQRLLIKNKARARQTKDTMQFWSSNWLARPLGFIQIVYRAKIWASCGIIALGLLKVWQIQCVTCVQKMLHTRCEPKVLPHWILAKGSSELLQLLSAIGGVASRMWRHMLCERLRHWIFTLKTQFVLKNGTCE